MLILDNKMYDKKMGQTIKINSQLSGIEFNGENVITFRVFLYFESIFYDEQIN